MSEADALHAEIIALQDKLREMKRRWVMLTLQPDPDRDAKHEAELQALVDGPE
jgi:hypothetical protein